MLNSFNFTRRPAVGIALAASLAGTAFCLPARAAEYDIDLAHSFIQFRIQHLGYSWLLGRFNDFGGTLSYDADNPAASAINVTIDTESIDTNHAKRDKHIRSEDFLDVEKFPMAAFKSTGYTGDGNKGTLTGELTLHGVTKTISFDVSKIGEGDDPWGGYRAGFEGSTELVRADYGVSYNLGPASEKMELELYVEGIRK